MERFHWNCFWLLITSHAPHSKEPIYSKAKFMFLLDNVSSSLQNTSFALIFDQVSICRLGPGYGNQVEQRQPFLQQGFQSAMTGFNQHVSILAQPLFSELLVSRSICLCSARGPLFPLAASIRARLTRPLLKPPPGLYQIMRRKIV